MDNLNEFSGKLLEYLNSTEVFLKAQMPDVVNQFIAYETWEAEWSFKFCIAGTLILLAVQLFVVYKAIKSRSMDELFPIVGMIGVIGTAFLIGTAIDYKELKKLQMAPKVFMIEKAKELLTKGDNKK